MENKSYKLVFQELQTSGHYGWNWELPASPIKESSSSALLIKKLPNFGSNNATAGARNCF